MRMYFCPWEESMSGQTNSSLNKHKPGDGAEMQH